MRRLGFIGTGNMGGALIRAASKDPENELILANRHPEKAQTLLTELNTAGCVTDNAGAASEADYLFLGVKPQMFAEMTESIRAALAGRSRRVILVTMAAGISLTKLAQLLGADYPAIRIMPNTPASIGEGMILYTCTADVTAEEEAEFLQAMRHAGRFSRLTENQIDAGSAVSGCGPAFVDLFIEALADGGVACGLPRRQALEFAAQMVAGSARLVLESGKHPAELKDAVCSPGGTTIQGVRKLEENGFRGTVMDAVIAAYEKNFHL